MILLKLWLLKKRLFNSLTADAFHRELTMNEHAHYIVLEKDGRVVGYCGLWIIIDESHITNIAILPEYRGQKLEMPY